MERKQLEPVRSWRVQDTVKRNLATLYLSSFDHLYLCGFDHLDLSSFDHLYVSSFDHLDFSRFDHVYLISVALTTYTSVALTK